MDDKKTVDVLNKLVEINNDRIDGYETAAKETEEQDLKTLFNEFAQTSQKLRQELASEITRLGGEPTEGTRTTGKMFRLWMDIKAAVTGKDRKSILSSCEFGEDHAKSTYENVMEDDVEHLTAGLISLITTQHSKIMGEHNRVKAMRDAEIKITQHT